MEVKDEIRQFFEDNFMAEFESDFGDDDSFLDNGIIDSTGVLELVLFIEETYELKVQDEEIIPENLDSFNNLNKYISSKSGKN
jgi:acyl carrier protein